MAYAAVISLKQTINGITNSYNFPSNSQILEFAYNQTTSLQQVLEKSNDSSRSSSKRIEALEGLIRDCAHKLEDALEFHELNSSRDDHNFEDDEEVRQEITSFAETVKKMEQDYIEELSRDEDEDDDDDDGADIDFGLEMVGRSSLFTDTREHLLNRMRPDDMCFFSLCGESGSGRTIAAKIVFDEVRNGFDCSDQSNGSIVFLTTSLEEVDKLGDINYYSNERDLRYYVERIWFSFRLVLFGTKSISRELENAGKKILENCRGRYISAAKTFLFLQKSEPTLQHWSKIAEDKENPIFIVADEISEVPTIYMEAKMNKKNQNIKLG